MISHFKNLIVVLSTLFSLAFAPTVFAQDAGADDILGQSMGDLMIVGGAGAGGALLGLSTLSFVEEPGKHLKNVVAGAAIGIIVGVGVVAYMQATKSHDIYNQASLLKDSNSFGTYTKNEWHQISHQAHESTSSQDQIMSYQFTF